MSGAWPEPQPPAQDASSLARYGDALLALLDQGGAPAAGVDRAGQPLLQVLDQLAQVMQSASPGSVRRQASWWDRLWGRDVARELDAQSWQPRFGVLLLQADAALQAVRDQGVVRDAAQARAATAVQALQAWVAAGQAQLASLPAPLQEVLAQRLDHLRRLGALQQVEVGQWQLLAEQDGALLARSQRIVETLLPAWRQAVLVRRAGDQQQRDQQAARLHAQVSAELASVQARLD